MKTVKLVPMLAAMVLPVVANAQTASSDLMVQQKYTRIERPSQEILEALETTDKEKVSVGIEQRGRTFVLPTQTAPLPVQNSAELSKYVQRIPYEYEIERDDDDAASVRIQAQQLTAVKRWRDSEFPTKASYGELDQAYTVLNERALEIASAEATDEQVQAFNQQLDLTRRELVEAYAAVDPSDIETQHRIIENFQEVERTGKALYGLNRDDRYPPEAYQRIYQNSRGALAILAQGQDVHCSGVLIARRYALTNHHCIKDSFPSELRVRFDYEELIDGSTLPTRTLPVTAAVPFTTSQRQGYDFAVLEIGEDGPDGNLAGDLYPVQCLSLARVRRDDPLYLIGHPLGDPRTVHDNTFVYFPFRVTEFEFQELEMAVRSEFLGADDETERLQEFRTSYRTGTLDGVTVRENFSLRWRQQPTIGVDSDTFHGNSGSPTFSRKTHRVVGILFDGEDDLDDPWRVGWRAHEAVLPIAVIVERLDTVHPGWRNWDGVCIDEA